MSNNTKISWSDAKWNPIIGDLEWPGSIIFDSDILQQPYHWKKPRKIFVCSMSDLFHEAVPDSWIAQVFKTIYECDWHTFLILTKRPERMMKVVRAHYEELGSYSDPPPKHVWLGVSVENQQAADERIPYLLKTPAAVRFVSCEPLLGEINLRKYLWDECMTECVIPRHNGPDGHKTLMNEISWIVTGGETGPGARPVHPEWVRSLRAQCQEAQVSFYFKSWGEWQATEDFDVEEWRDFRDRGVITKIQRLNLAGGQGFHGDSVIYCRRVGKKQAGKELDGRTWDEFPAVKP